MFMGEMLCLAYWFWKRRRARLSADAGDQPLLASARARVGSGTTEEDNSVGWRSSFVCIVPTVCDLSQTTLSGIGLLFTTASVYQMLRGSVILFAALLSVLFLGRKLRAYQWFGMALTVIGISMVGVSSYLQNQQSATDAAYAMYGNALVIVAQLLAAVRSVLAARARAAAPPDVVCVCALAPVPNGD